MGVQVIIIYVNKEREREVTFSKTNEKIKNIRQRTLFSSPSSLSPFLKKQITPYNLSFLDCRRFFLCLKKEGGALKKRGRRKEK